MLHILCLKLIPQDILDIWNLRFHDAVFYSAGTWMYYWHGSETSLLITAKLPESSRSIIQ